jgi:hypothetical protein
MRRIHWILLSILTIGSLILSYATPGPSHPHAWDGIPLFFAVFGFLGCLLIIFLSKAIGKFFLQKEEDYYDRY